MLDRSMLNTLCQMAHGVARQFGENCEVMVYELDPWRQEGRVVAAENSRSSDSEQEAKMEAVVREVLQSGSAALLQDRLAFLVKTEDGRVLKSSTMYIRDTKGAVCGVFSVNWDITGLLAAEEGLRSLTETVLNQDHAHLNRDSTLPDQDCTPPDRASSGHASPDRGSSGHASPDQERVTPDQECKEEREATSFHVSGILDDLIAQSIRLVGKPVSEMTKEDKIRAIQFLSQAGAFLITKSGDKVTKEFGISKYTLYSYIDAGKEK